MNKFDHCDSVANGVRLAYRRDARRADKFRSVCFPKIHSIESVESVYLELIHISTRWSEEIKRAHESASIVGGSVENASVERALDWAVYFYDYGKYMVPNRAGAPGTLSGINVSYKRAILDEIREIYRNGFYETFVNEELKKRGHQLVLTPSAIVYHKKNYKTRRAAEHSYHLARSFAAQRVADSDFLKRAFFAATSLILPVLLPARIILATMKKGRHLKELVSATPYLIFLMLIWSYGEFCGYLLGAGNSADEWR